MINNHNSSPPATAPMLLLLSLAASAAVAVDFRDCSDFGETGDCLEKPWAKQDRKMMTMTTMTEDEGNDGDGNDGGDGDDDNGDAGLMGPGTFLVTKRYTRFQDSSISYCIGMCQYTYRVDYSACYDVCTWNGRSPSPWKDFMKNLSKMQPAAKKLLAQEAKDPWYPFRWNHRKNRLDQGSRADRRPDRSLPRNRPRSRNRGGPIDYLGQ